MVIACDLIQFCGLIWLIWARQLWMLYIFAIIFGLTFGGSSAIITVFIGDIFGTRSLGAIMGILTSGFGLGAAIGPAIGGYVFDVSGQYSAAFATASVALLVAACLIVLVRKDSISGG
jgi:MFS family permease